MLAVPAGGDSFTGHYPLRTMRRICREMALVSFRQSVYCPTVVITSALACCSSLETTNLLRPTGPTPPSSEVPLALQVQEQEILSISIHLPLFSLRNLPLQLGRAIEFLL